MDAAVDPRLQPGPDYGTLGPSSDIAVQGPDPVQISQPQPALRVGPLVAAALGVFVAVLGANIGNARSVWSRFADLFSSQEYVPTGAKDSGQLDRLKPQKQAETLLELAVDRSDGAVEQISSRVGHWQGKVKWNSQIATLTAAALNSNDLRVRESGIEVELAAYGLAKNSSSFEYLVKTVESPAHAQKIWALWALGLMGNRGVEPDRATEILTTHLNDVDEDSRRWAVEGLTLVGSNSALETLLKTMHDDPSPGVRERAACGLAEAGMFNREQRLTAVLQLISDTDDPSLDAQTHAWAFQALKDITHERLPSDSAAWRSWYKSSRPD